MSTNRLGKWRIGTDPADIRKFLEAYAPAGFEYSYDTLDNLTCVEQRGNVSGTGCASAPANDATSPWRVRRFAYNSLSQLLSATNPESGAITYAYDNDGNLLTKVSPRPNQYVATVTLTTTFEYDELHRMKRKYFTGLSTPEVRNFYDGAAPSVSGCSPTIGNSNGVGRRTAMCDGAGFSAWTYEAGGKPLIEQRKTNGITKQTTYQYNEDDSVKSIQYPGSSTLVNYGYDAAGRPASAIGNGTNYVTNAKYAASGALCSAQHGASITSTFTYNSRMQPNRAQVTTTGAPLTPCDPPSTAPGNVMDFTYGFNLGASNNGNVASIANNRDSNRTQSFTYDELNRLRTAQSAATSGAHDWGLSFSYDIWANLKGAAVTKGDDVPMLSVGALPSNRMDNSCYDAAGNLVGPLPCGAQTHTYDAENRILTTGGVTYSYDGDGRRVAKSSGKSYWYGAGSDALVETDGFGNVADEFVFFAGKRVARRTPAGLLVNIHYYFADHLGSARVMTDASGVIKQESDLYPYGGERSIVNTVDNRYKFTGKERDTESGLDYFGARYYGSGFGRFTSADLPLADQRPSDPQSWNLYTYARNNPGKYTDPSGRFIKLAWMVAKAVYKGHDAYSTVKGVVDGVKTVFSGDARVGTGARLIAAAGVLGELSGASDLYKGAKGLSKRANALDNANDTRKSSNFVPSPDGRKGGPGHQAGVETVKGDVESRGLTAQGEYQVHTPGGEKESRFLDVVGKDADGNVVEMHQVGLQTKGSLPVSRERKAIKDIKDATGQEPEFHPYNQPK